MNNETTYQFRLYYTIEFTGGDLKGLRYNQSVGFCDIESAKRFEAKGRKGIKKPIFNGSPYRIVDASFQKYWRD